MLTPAFISPHDLKHVPVRLQPYYQYVVFFHVGESVSLEDIAQFFRVSQKTVSRAMRDLDRLGLIDRDRQSFTTTTYRASDRWRTIHENAVLRNCLHRQRAYLAKAPADISVL